MRWPITCLAVLLLTLLSGCDFGLAADEEVTAAGVQTTRGTLSHVSVTPGGLVDPYAPVPSQKTEQEEAAAPTQRETPTKLPYDEETPSHFPGVGSPVRLPPPPCPPPKAER